MDTTTILKDIAEIEKQIDTLKKKLTKMNDLTDIQDMLFSYYANGYPDMTEKLNRIACNRYFEIIELYYDKQYTIEQIAEIMGRDVSTITRNKKKLLLKMK